MMRDTTAPMYEPYKLGEAGERVLSAETSVILPSEVRFL
jgi:hypothetical protein